jgi:pyrroline-5-carboxylate reductase
VVASERIARCFDAPPVWRLNSAMPQTLGVIGGGNMGGAVVRGAIDAGLLSAEQIVLVDLDGEKRRAFADLGCAVSPTPAAALQCEQIMLAVKPQAFPDVAAEIAPLPRPTVVISVMAGRSSTAIHAALGENARVVRVMPNIACQVRAGASAIALGEGASRGDERLARAVFESLGRCIDVEESLLHAVTAVSGSGPGYVFLLAESMEQAAVKLGLSTTDARTLVAQTIVGAGTLLNETGRSPDDLRQAVTSPGGTTAAALEVLFERELPEIIAEALTAARDRSRELDADIHPGGQPASP